MRKHITVFALILITLFTGCTKTPVPTTLKSNSKTVTIKDLGIPFIESYPDDFISRCPWDLTIWENKLYVGAGDYGNNTGPVDCMAFDLNTQNWVNTGLLTTESIARFCVLDDTLVIPGIDSTIENNGWGEYYFLNNGKWQSNKNLPGGIHCFDLIKYNELIFAGLGVTQGEYPVAVSGDNGESFKQIPFYKDGKLLITNKDAIRVYDLLVVENSLYAIYTSENNEPGKPQDFECSIYEYQNEKFVYKTTLNPYFKSASATQIPFSSKVVFNNQLFVSTGYLYKMDDTLNSYTQISFPNEQITLDMCIQDNSLYILNNHPREDGTFDISVWYSNSGEPDTFKEVFSFNYSTPALSFVIQNNVYYIGIGNMALQHETNGSILMVQYNGQ